MPNTHVVTINGEQVIVYDSENTGEQLDAGIRKLAGLDADVQAAKDAAAAAEASKQAAASSQTAAARQRLHGPGAGQHGHHQGVGSGVLRGVFDPMADVVTDYLDETDYNAILREALTA